MYAIRSYYAGIPSAIRPAQACFGFKRLPPRPQPQTAADSETGTSNDQVAPWLCTDRTRVPRNLP